MRGTRKFRVRGEDSFFAGTDYFTRFFFSHGTPGEKLYVALTMFINPPMPVLIDIGPALEDTYDEEVAKKRIWMAFKEKVLGHEITL